MQPLAFQIRPKNLSEFIGQEHLVGKNKPVKIAIDKKHLFSFILWGPPGVGKTTLARIYAHEFDADLIELSAVSAGKGDIKKFLQTPTAENVPKILFLDEVHRFNKAQQDFLLPFVERGDIVFIGSTTENPSFRVISALLSRVRVFVLNPLTENQMRQIIKRTKIKMDKIAQDWVISMADGDARQAITIIEAANHLYKKVTTDTLKEALQNKFLRYDRQGEEHYNTISAFIKSMRASQPDAAIYYLARMIDGGEDPLFIARRMVIFASEDIGMAQPTALVVANEVYLSCEKVGLPECEINLAHGVAYLCKAPKDRSAYNAFRAAQADVKKYGSLPVPMELRNAPTQLMKELGYGANYKAYTSKSLLPDKISHKKYLR